MEVNDENFESIIKEHSPILIKFGAQWCGPCRMMEPMLKELEADFPDITFAHCDTDKSTETASKLSIVSLPTLVMFKEGKEVGRIVGVQSGKSGIKKWIAK
jgi:thioredoxin 1